MRLWICIFTLMSTTVGRVASAHDDILPYPFGGKLLTGGHDDTLGTTTASEQVFGYDFGEDPLDPYYIGDPGFNNGTFAIGTVPGDGLLPSGYTLGFNVLTNLQYWDGTGAVSFVAAPIGVELGLNRGSNTVNVSGSGTSGAVPTIGSTGLGRLHVHMASLLNYTDGVDPTLPNAPDGVYLVGLNLTLPGSGIADSDPIYLVYNNGLDEQVHDEAIDWVRSNLVVPEPSSWLLMGAAIAAVAACGHRRRRAGLRG